MANLNNQETRHAIRVLLLEEATITMAYEEIMMAQAALVLLMGREGLTLEEQYQNFVKLKNIQQFLYPAGSSITMEQAEAFKMIHDTVNRLNPNVEVDVDKFEQDFYDFLDGEASGDV